MDIKNIKLKEDLKKGDIMKILFKMPYRIGEKVIKSGEIHDVTVCYINNISTANTKGFQGDDFIIPVWMPGIDIVEGSL
jgi:hypothetical protein